jgi:Cytochrome c oxidase assembly protein CtaG/Cox11
MSPPPSLQTRNRRLAWVAVATALAMVGASYAAVPLYAEFCKRTGFAGTTQVARTAPAIRGERSLVVRFDANVSQDLDWTFEPETPSITLRTGATATVFFRVHNRSRRDAGSTRFPASASASSGSDPARPPTFRSSSFSIRVSSTRTKWTMSKRSRSPIRCSPRRTATSRSRSRPKPRRPRQNFDRAQLDALRET